MTQITMMVVICSHVKPDTRSGKSGGTQEASLQSKLVEVMEFQLNYFKS